MGGGSSSSWTLELCRCGVVHPLADLKTSLNACSATVTHQLRYHEAPGYVWPVEDTSAGALSFVRVRYEEVDFNACL